jgi:hypothetical protein
VRRAPIIVVSALAALVSSGMASARSTYDGLWSVLIVTEQGTCDRGYRYALRIANGAVRYEGEAAISVRGSVSSNGAVRVSIRRGDQGADGSGRLSGDRGGGRWTASLASGRCSGTWTAERR